MNLIRIIKLTFKRITCKHEYKQVCRLFATNKISNKEVDLKITYECVHCKKIIDFDIFDDSIQY